MHQIITTEAIVLAKRAVGEASARITLLTREHGLLRAAARSSRVEHSKLRYGLEPLTLARYCLVRGKYEWRLTGVEEPSRGLVAPDALRRRVAGRVAQLVLRLIHGEEASPLLYADIKEGLLLLAGTGPGEVEAVESVLVLRILWRLGYLPHTEALAAFVEGEWSLELSAKALASRSLLVRTINESLQATGL